MLFFQGNVIDIGIDIVDVLRIQDKVVPQTLIIFQQWVKSGKTPVTVFDHFGGDHLIDSSKALS